MPYADLHVHTTRSDGSLERAAVPEAARRAGVEAVALTDHDRLQPVAAPVVERDGVTIVNGIELRVVVGAETADRRDDDRLEGQRVDLLGYGVEPTPALEELVAEIQTNRIERGRAIVECVEDRLGIDLDVAIGEGFGRPHVARAIDAHPDADDDYEGAFDGLIGNDDPCFVPRDIPTFERGRRVLAAASSVVSLAHPLRYPEPNHALALAADLDAVELWYPYDHDADRSIVEQAIERHDLLATGGSDAHGDVLGVAGVTRDAYERLGLSTG